MIRIKSLALVLALTVISCISEAGASTNPQRQKIQSAIRTNLVVQRLDARQYCERGWEKYSANDFQGAIADFTEAIRLKSDYIAAYEGRADSKTLMEDSQGATADHQKVGEIIDNQVAQSTDAERYVIRGDKKAQPLVGDYQGAIADFTEAIRLNPDLAEAYYLRGKVKLELGDSQGAIDDTTEAIRLKPDLALAYDTRSSAKSQLGDLQGSSLDAGKFEKFRYCQFNGDMPKPTTFVLRSNNTTPNVRQTNAPQKTYQEVDVPDVALKLSTRPTNTTPNVRQTNTPQKTYQEGVALKLSTRQTNTTPNTRQATPSNPIATSFPPAKGLTEGQVLERLSGIPVFVIVDDRNNPLLVDNPQQSKKQASFYLGADEAEVILNQFKTAYPEVGNKAKIITRSMKDIYQFIRQNKGKNIAFKIVSKRSNIEAARSILAAQGKPINYVPEVPVFFATIQRANGQRLLTVDGNGEKFVPIFFDKSDLDGLLNRNRETVQKIINIQVASLFQVLDSMVTKNNQPNPEIELFRFVSSGASLDYAKRNRQ